MKKNIIFVVLMMLLALPAMAKVKYGVRGGYNIADVSYDKDVISSRNRKGFFFGPAMKIGTPILDLDLAALYDQIDMEVDEVQFRKKTVDLQANLRKGFGLGDMCSVFVFAGPQWGFSLGDKRHILSETFYESKEWRWKRDVEFRVNIGVGAMLLNHLELRLSYSFSDDNTADVNYLDEVGNIVRTLNSPKTTATQLGVTIYF